MLYIKLITLVTYSPEMKTNLEVLTHPNCSRNNNNYIELNLIIHFQIININIKEEISEIKIIRKNSKNRIEIN